MTLKEINKLACDDCIYILESIHAIKENLVYKTVYEQKTAQREIRNLSIELQELLKRIEG